MCKIIILNPGYTLPKDMLYNAVYNNPDGYGLILKDKPNKKIQVIKKLPENKENDPEEIYNLLKDNEDITRYLHVRHRTEGDISKDNLHPFTAYHSDRKTVLFMHNGTLNDFAPKRTYVNNQWQGPLPGDPEANDSDSKIFNDTLLSPFLLETKGNYHSAFFKKVIDKFWGYGNVNKGLIVSNDQDELLINPTSWVTITDPDGKTFKASNDSYFKAVIRGPEYERRKKKKEEEEAVARQARFKEARDNPPLLFGRPSSEDGDSWPVAKLKDVNLQKTVYLNDDIKNLLMDTDIWNKAEEGIAALSNLTDQEIETFVKNDNDNAVYLMVHILEHYNDLWKRHQRTTKYLASLKKENKEKK